MCPNVPLINDSILQLTNTTATQRQVTEEFLLSLHKHACWAEINAISHTY